MNRPIRAPVGGHDEPVSEREDDLLNRWSVARSIDRVISNAPQGWSTRIGLYGPWGTGKTSVLRFLRTLSQERGDIVVEFSAWQALGEGGVLQLFHKELLNVLEARKMRIEPRLSWMKRKLSSAAAIGRGIGGAGAKAGSSVDGDIGQVISAVSMAVDFASETLGGSSSSNPRTSNASRAHLAHAAWSSSSTTWTVLTRKSSRRRCWRSANSSTGRTSRSFSPSTRPWSRARWKHSEAFGQSADDFLEKVVDVPFELPDPTPDQVSPGLKRDGEPLFICPN